jgi:hypothetical protein
VVLGGVLGVVDGFVFDGFVVEGFVVEGFVVDGLVPFGVLLLGDVPEGFVVPVFGVGVVSGVLPGAVEFPEGISGLVLGDGVVSGGGVGVVLPGAGFCVDGGFCVPLVGLVVELPLCPDEGALLPGVCAIAQAPHANITANIIILIFICQPPLQRSIRTSFPDRLPIRILFRIPDFPDLLTGFHSADERWPQVSGINLRFNAELS